MEIKMSNRIIHRDRRLAGFDAAGLDALLPANLDKTFNCEL
jgi:hypothetical protein